MPLLGRRSQPLPRVRVALPTATHPVRETELRTALRRHLCSARGDTRPFRLDGIRDRPLSEKLAQRDLREYQWPRSAAARRAASSWVAVSRRLDLIPRDELGQRELGVWVLRGSAIPLGGRLVIGRSVRTGLGALSERKLRLGAAQASLQVGPNRSRCTRVGRAAQNATRSAAAAESGFIGAPIWNKPNGWRWESSGWWPANPQTGRGILCGSAEGRHGRKSNGSNGFRLSLTSKCTWDPLALPLEPTSPITSPFSTKSPFPTRLRRLWAYTVE